LLLPPPEETNIEPFHKADLSGTEIDVFIFLGKSIEAKKKKKTPHRRFVRGSLSSSVPDPSFLIFSLLFFTRFFLSSLKPSEEEMDLLRLPTTSFLTSTRGFAQQQQLQNKSRKIIFELSSLG
jgi:hypothetical protein